MVPDPVRLAEAIVIHDGIPVAVHAHPEAVETVKVLLLPVADAETLAGVTVNAHVPDCVTVNVCPAIITDPVRSAAPLLAATLMVAVPLPVPRLPEGTVIHEAPLVAVHAQPLPAVMPTVIVSPAVTTALLVRLSA
jgi:hypothetical protein